MMKPRIGNLRAYLAGTGATGALIAGALVAFLTVGALVAFNGFPLGGDDADGSVSLADQPGGQAPESAAAALGATPGAVAATPAGGTVLAAILPGGIGIGPGGPIGGTGPGGGTGGGDNPTTPVDPGGGSGVVGGAVEDVDGSTGGLGLPPLGPATSGVTDQADQALNNTLDNVGGAVGQPNLGNDVNDTVNGVTGGLLGNGGLLGGN